jgi:hypothetical protein
MKSKSYFWNYAAKIAEGHSYYLRFVPSDMTKDECVLLFCFMAAAHDAGDF